MTPQFERSTDESICIVCGGLCRECESYCDDCWDSYIESREARLARGELELPLGIDWSGV